MRPRPERSPATIDDEGLVDASAANPFRLPRLHPEIGFPGGSWERLVPVGLPLILRRAALSRPTGSECERDDEIGEARRLIESVDEFLHASYGGGAEHHTRQLSKLRPNFVFSIGLLEVAACAFSQPCDLTPIGERDGHPCWLESRHAGVERRILANSDSPADRRDRGISNRLFRESVIPR